MEGNTDPVQDAEGEVADDFQVPENFGTNAEGEVIDETWAQEAEKQLADKYGGDFLKVVYNYEQNRESYFCDVCEAELNTKKIIELHCGGARHKRKVEELQELREKGITAPPKKLGWGFGSRKGLVSILERKKVAVGRVLQKTDNKNVNGSPWAEFVDTHVNQGNEPSTDVEPAGPGPQSRPPRGFGPQSRPPRGPGPRAPFFGPGNFRGPGPRFFRGMNPRFGFRPRFDGPGPRPNFRPNGPRPFFRPNGPRPDYFGPDGPGPDFFGPNGPGPEEFGPNGPEYFDPNGPGPEEFGPNGPDYFDPNGPGPEEFGPNGPDSEEFGSGEFGPDQFGPNEPGPDQFGSDGPGPNECGPDGSDSRQSDTFGPGSRGRGLNQMGPRGRGTNQMWPRGPNPTQMMGPRGRGSSQMWPRGRGPNQAGPRVPGPNQMGPGGPNQTHPNTHGENQMGDRGSAVSSSDSHDMSCDKGNHGEHNPLASDSGAGQASDAQVSGPQRPSAGEGRFATSVKRARLEDDEKPPGSNSQGLGGGGSVYFTADSNIGHPPVSDEPKDFAVPIVVDGESLAAGGSTGILLKKLAGCVIKSEKDAELALTVSNALVSSLREYYIRKEELKTAELLMNAELKLNTLKAMKVGLKLLDEELMKTPASSAASRKPATQTPTENTKAAQLTAFPAPPLTRMPPPSVPPPSASAPPPSYSAAPPTSQAASTSHPPGSYSSAAMSQSYSSPASAQPDFSKPPPGAHPPTTSAVVPSGPPPSYGYNSMASQYSMNTLQPPGFGPPSYSYSAPVPYPGTYPQTTPYSTPAVGQYNSATNFSVPPPSAASGSAPPGTAAAASTSAATY